MLPVHVRAAGFFVGLIYEVIIPTRLAKLSLRERQNRGERGVIVYNNRTGSCVVRRFLLIFGRAENGKIHCLNVSTLRLSGTFICNMVPKNRTTRLLRVHRKI